MNTNKFVMLTVGIVVAVVLVSGVMIPVIGNASSGGDKTYKNTGEYYYTQAKEGDNHTIVITNDGTKATITYDGDTLKEIALGNEFWFIPLFTFDQDGEKKFCILEYLVGTGMDSPPTEDKILDIPYTGGAWANSEEMTITINGTQVTVTESGSSDSTPYTVDIYLSKTGEFVWADDPIINPETSIYAMDGKGVLTIDGNNRKWVYGAVGCYGLIDEMQELLENSFLVKDSMKYDGSGWEAISPGTLAPGPENIVAAPQITEIDGLDKIDGINIETLWQNEDSFNIDVQRFIVPVEVSGSGGSSNGLSPTVSTVLSIVPLLIVVSLIVSAIVIIKKQ